MTSLDPEPQPTEPAGPQPNPQPEAAPAPAEEAAQVRREDLEQSAQVIGALRKSVSRSVLGQQAVVDQVLVALLAGGHVLLEGKPGLGKTLLVLRLAQAFGGQWARIQFTPDLMPTDVTGHTMFDMASQKFEFRRGPVFTNLLLADEINRAPAKTQAALLEVMQESQVTVDGQCLPLNPPFMTLATQNPIEQEGTYPLPEAQLDRFLLKVLIDYPSMEDEKKIASISAANPNPSKLDATPEPPVCTPEQLIAAQQTAARVQAVDAIVDYACQIVRATRQNPGVSVGAGTRGAIALLRSAKALALMAGRNFVVPDDIKRLAPPTLRHRVIVAPELTISGQSADDVLRSIVESVEAPRQ